MKAKKIFLLALSLALCYTNMPVASSQLISQRDTTRKLRNVAKSAFKEFDSSALDSYSPNISPEIALANMTGPELMKDLFIDLLNSTTQANIIRSLEYSPKGKKNGCDDIVLQILAI